VSTSSGRGPASPDRPARHAHLSADQKRALLAKLLQKKLEGTGPAAGTPAATPLSYGQRALWFLHRLDPESAAYNLHFCAHIRARLESDHLRRALRILLTRHASLRSTFVDRGDGPVQLVYDAAEPELDVVDATAWDGVELDRRLHEAAHGPFNLERGPVFRAFLYHRGPDDSVLLIALHHIISDHWTLGVLIDELNAIVPSVRTGNEPVSGPPPVAYGEFVRWQADLLAGPEGDRQWDYWRRRLSGELPALQLPTDRPRPPAQTNRGGTHRFLLAGPLAAQLRELARSERTTLFAVLLAGYQALLHRLTGQDNVLVGTPVAGRNRPEFAGIAGYFVNMLVLRADLSARPTFRTFLGQVRQSVLEALENQDFPFALLVERLQPARDLSRSPLFQAAFVLTKKLGSGPAAGGEVSNSARPETHHSPLTVGGVALEPIDLDARAVPFDWNLLVEETETGLGAALQYNADLFEADTVARWMGHFQTLLAAAAGQPGQPIAALPLMTDKELARLHSWCHGAEVERPDEPLHRLIEQQVEHTPDDVAVSFDGQTLSYRQLNLWANQIAHQLIGSGVRPDTPVALCVERSFEMVVGLLAALKAGGAYVPLDPDLPRERLDLMLADLAPAAILTLDRLADRLAPTAARVFRLDGDARLWQSERTDNPAAAVSADQLAYIIYTSGSTGTPKGCMNTHRAIVNRLLWMQQTYRLTSADRVLQKTPYSFDVSVWEFFWPLLAGARLVVARPGGHRDPTYLAGLIAAQGVTILHFVPSMLPAFLAADGLDQVRSLRQVVCSGEALGWELQQQFVARFPGVALHNLYGPTEAAVDVTDWPCDPDDPRRVVPIGRPIANTQTYVLDADLRPQPVGVPGELYIGGVQVARGYWRRPELTGERFVPDPYRPGGRLYRTGDRARYLADGAIEYLGRLDTQVKVRGFRIELGEIEIALSQHPAVREAAVVARMETQSPRLFAYVVAPTGASAPTATELRTFLGAKLPDYMVPAAFVPLAALPLTPNGKVDRNALPAPDAGRPDLAAAYQAPRTPTEGKLAALWTDVLRLDRVGLHDDFFELGGHSLLATQILTRVRADFGVEVPLRRFFEAPTVAALAAAVEEQNAPTAVTSLSAAPLRPVPRDGPLPMSYGQETLWFLDQLEPGNTTYNCPAAVRMTGPLEAEALRRTFELIVHRHESLRSTFKVQDDQLVVEIMPRAPLPMAVTDLRNLSPTEREARARELADAEARKPFDLARGPMLRLSLLRLSDQDHIVLMTVHHIAYDGWSTGVLVHEFATLYRWLTEAVTTRPSLRAPHQLPLPPLAVQYPEWADWQRRWLADGLLDQQLAYWKERLRGVPPLLALPTDRPRPHVWTFRGATVPLHFPPSLVAQLRALGKQEGCTLFMTLLAAFEVLLHRYTGQDDICVGSPIANRNRVEVEGLIGFVVNTLVLRGDVSGNPTFRALMRRVRDTALGAYAHQDVPFERLMQAVNPNRDVRHSSLFQVLFVLQNAPVHIPPIPGLTARLLLDGHNGTAKFDLTLGLTEMPEGLVGIFEYNRDLFDATTIERMAGHFRRLLEEVVADAARPIGDLPLLSDDERRHIAATGEGSRCAGHLNAEVATPRTLPTLFEARVTEQPDAVAVVWGDERLTYRELSRRANRIARYLRGRGVGPEALVGLYLERSVETVVGLLAVLKAGGAYVPLDPALPRDRLAVVLADSQPALVLTQQRLRSDLPFDAERVVALDVTAPPWNGLSDADVESTVSPDNLAYVIYTSGSTGTPKGCMIEHRSLINAYDGWDLAYRLRELSGALVMVNFAFDVFTGELTRTLGSGGKLVLCPTEALLDPEGLLALIRREEVQYAEFVPAVMRPLLRYLETTGQALGPVKLVVVGSDVWYGGEFHRLRRVLGPNVRLVNSYGLTEATIDNLYFDGTDDGLYDDGPIPIGRPYANQRACVLDARLNLQPIGVSGELHVGGAGLARGYLNRTELTAQKFIPDPYHPGERLYKSGDLARMLPSGAIELLGRTDNQVKVRGFRIELGEIEATLTQHPAVREAAVVARDDGDGKRLVAYVVVAESAAAPSVTDLRSFLGGKLPEYMVPSVFMPLAALPLSVNGKVDRRALPAPDLSRPALAVEFVPPRTPTEVSLAAIWAHVLRVARVGVRDNFFELGGHSLVATQVLARVRTEFGIELPLRKLFEAPVLADFASAVDGVGSAVRTDVSPELVRAADPTDWNAEAALDPAITADGLPGVRAGEPRVILLTGATGFLGAFLLDELLRQTSAQVVCLARAESDAEAGGRVRRNLAQYDLDIGDRAQRLRPLAGDLAEPRLGLTPGRFAELAAVVDVIFHNGALVHFLHPYSTLKAANVLGTREVLRLATTDRLKPVHFVSTLSVLTNLARGERALESARNARPDALENGYAQSKWVAEEMVWEAIARGVPASVYRPGRIVWHSRTGALGSDDLFSRAIRACVQLAAVPALDTYLELTPVDFVSRAVVHLGLQPDARGRAYHLFNRQFVRLRHLLEWVRALGYPLEVISPDQWLARVHASATQGTQDALTALLPLLANGVPFLEGEPPAAESGPNLDDQNTQALLAGTDVECPPITAESVGVYVARMAAAALLAPARRGPARPLATNGTNGHGHAARSRTRGMT
jgi:amino acid adenylation domain-containing protein/thioester reductase-like protein